MLNGLTKSGLQTLGNIIKKIYDEDDTALQLEPDIAANGRITNVLSKFIITPNIVVDNNLRYMETTTFNNLIKTEMMTFTGIVTQAIRIMVEIHGINPVVAIDKLNKTSTLEDLDSIRNFAAGNEEFDYIGDLLNNDTLPALESFDKEDVTKSTLENNNYIQKDVSSFINSYELQLSFESAKGNKRVITLPIIIYPNIVYTKMGTLMENMVDSKHGKGFFDVVDDYRAGLKSLSDLIFSTSLVKEYRKKKLDNENDFATYLNKVDKIHSVKDLIHNKNSFSKNFNIYIFDSSFTTTLNKLVKGNILKDKYKDMVTNKLSAFSLTIVDVEQEEVTMLLDGIPGFSVLNYQMLKKEKDSDIAKVVKELMQNKPPF